MLNLDEFVILKMLRKYPFLSKFGVDTAEAGLRQGCVIVSGRKIYKVPFPSLPKAGGERFRGKSEKRGKKSMVAAGNGPSIANQRLLQYVTWKKGRIEIEMDQQPRTEMHT